METITRYLDFLDKKTIMAQWAKMRFAQPLPSGLHPSGGGLCWGIRTIILIIAVNITIFLILR